MIGAYFKPLYDSSFISWAVEGTLAQGWMNDRNIRNGMIIPGINFDLATSHYIYIEAVWKDWYNSAQDSSSSKDNKGNSNRAERHFGLREFFYRYDKISSTRFTLGLQTMTLGDYLLVDDRVLGASYTQKISSFQVQASIGTVSRSFARQRSVCGVRHIYNLTAGADQDYISEKIGKTNLGAIVVKWLPNSLEPQHQTISRSSLSAEDDKTILPTDEFFEEFTPQETTNCFINELGLIFYEEFGADVPQYKYYFGALSSFNLPFDSKINIELVNQYIPDEKVLAYMAEFQKDFSWVDGDVTQFELGYLGKIDIDNNKYFYPAYSNLYLGEVMRLDAREFPIVYSSLKHSFPWKSKLYIKFTGINQFQDYNTNEIDLEIGFKFFHHFKLTSLLSRINSKPFNDVWYIARFELRAAI
ncbi:MAG: hypothetical protein KBA52_07930 [Candidatus Kapabacteria bacterium]|nr:hypothetical protein [Candidatus Kapabacteria bacterium]